MFCHVLKKLTFLVKFDINKAILEPRVSPILEPRVSPAFAFTYFCNLCNIWFMNQKVTFDPDDLWPTPIEVTCATLPKHHYVQVQRKYISVCGYSDHFSKTSTTRSKTLGDLRPHFCWGHMCDSTQGLLCLKSHGNTSKYVDTTTIFRKLQPKGQWPQMTPRWTSVKVTCATLPKDHFVQVPWKYIKVYGYNDHFSKPLTKRSMTLGDLWPHFCCGHMCNSTQGSLCQVQSMWI